MERKSSKEYSVVSLVKGEKFKLPNQPSRTSSLISSRRRACPVLKHNRVSKVFKWFKVHHFKHYGQRNYVLKWKFNLSLLGNLICVIMCHLCMLTMTLKKY